MKNFLCIFCFQQLPSYVLIRLKVFNFISIHVFSYFFLLKGKLCILYSIYDYDDMTHLLFGKCEWRKLQTPKHKSQVCLLCNIHPHTSDSKCIIHIYSHKKRVVCFHFFRTSFLKRKNYAYYSKTPTKNNIEKYFLFTYVNYV